MDTPSWVATLWTRRTALGALAWTRRLTEVEACDLARIESLLDEWEARDFHGTDLLLRMRRVLEEMGRCDDPSTREGGR